VLPDIEISWTEYRPDGSDKFTLRCAREATTLDKEWSKHVPSRGHARAPSSRFHYAAMRRTWGYCLGLSKSDVWVPSVTPDFEKAVSENKCWTVRHLSLPISCDPYLYTPIFLDLAHRKAGGEWETCDLKYIVEGFEKAVGIASLDTTWS